MKSSKPLFSQHYLERRLPNSSEWNQEVLEPLQRLRTLYTRKQPLLPTLNEAQTEAEFIQPVLEILGFVSIVQTPARKGGQFQRPDYALFGDDKTKTEAYPFQKNNEAAFYSRTLAVADAKYWERPLNEVSRHDGRDAFKNTNPSFQIANYLTGTGVDWGMLTNGRFWRLYYRKSASPVQQFYEIDLASLLESGEAEAFKYFWCFFRKEAFVKDARGKNFLERVREGSSEYATIIEKELKNLVFDRVFSSLAGGFVAGGTARGETLTDENSLKQVYQATLSFLYKILFLLYAEARGLLPVEGDYRDYSLSKILEEIAFFSQDKCRGEAFAHKFLLPTERGSTQMLRPYKPYTTVMFSSETAAGFYDRLLNLFQIIDRGDSSLQVPRYNGGLFKTTGKLDDIPEANRFLMQHKLTDAVLAPALDKLARLDGEPIDYSFIDVRHLGAIYEGLLEYRLVVDDAKSGKVHLETDKGERKATGSYYTPEYIVRYIVKQTLEPIIAERAQRFKELMAQISQVRQQLQDGRLAPASIKTLRQDLQRLERKTWETLLDIKVCDPAMGSGHFLVTAVDFITAKLIGILGKYPEDNPVIEQLEKIREDIIRNLRKQGISIEPSQLRDDNLLHRAVMKRCIYGVDLNPMAVELCKISLWLHLSNIASSLSFLDSHLRCGNSLMGAAARKSKAKIDVTKCLGNKTETSEYLFINFDRKAKPYKQLLDIDVSRNFGVKGADSFLRRYGAEMINANPEKISKADASVVREARRLYAEKRFFHWDLEFPEVFIDLETAAWKENPGFDAVVGNPPYVKIQAIRQADASAANYFSKIYETASDSYDLYMLVAERCLFLVNGWGRIGLILPNKFFTSASGKGLRNKIAQNQSLVELVDFGVGQVFEGATTYTCLLFLSGSDRPVFQYLKLTEPTDIISDSLPFRQILNKSLTEQPWTFAERDVSQILEKIAQYSLPLGQLADRLFQGIRTSDNKVYILKRAIATDNEKIIEGFSASLQRRVRVEKELCAAFVAGKEIQRYEVLGGGAIAIVPYRLVNERAELIPLEQLRSEYPLTYQYFLDNQAFLESREKGRLAETDKWHGFIYPKNLEVIRRPKVLSRDIIDRSTFSLDAEGSIAFVTGYGISLSPNCQYSLLYLLAILNSRLGDFALKQLNTFVRGGYARIFSQYLEPIPIRRINFTTSEPDRSLYLKRATSLYESGMTQNHFTTVVEFAQEQIERDRGDVVHDLLAYLAEQMIALNQQKKAEMKEFLAWLARELGNRLDSLTNQTSVRNYIGDEERGELPLSFEEFLQILKKNSKRLSVDISGRSFQSRLQQEYQASLEKLLPIQARLAATDRLIDAIVYRLYGLSDEEIAIVAAPLANS